MEAFMDPGADRPSLELEHFRGYLRLLAGLRVGARRRGRAQRAAAPPGRRPGRAARAAAAGGAAALLRGPLPARDRPAVEAFAGRGCVAAAPRPGPPSRTDGDRR